MFKQISSTLFRGLSKLACGNRSVCNRPAVAINGFGRIGKCVLRKSFEKDVNIVAVNQPFTDTNALAHALTYDTIHGPFDKKVHAYKNLLCIEGKHVQVFHEEDPEKIKWKDASVNYVIDSTGKFTDKDNAMKHVKAGAQKVIISSISKDAPMFVKGVNFEGYTNSMQVVSNSSCTTNCAAPLVKLLHQKFGVVNCLLTTTHAMTATQHVHDGLNNRSGPGNIVPSTTGAATAVSTVISEFKDKVKGDAARVPILNVSLLKLFINLKECATVDAIKNEIKQRADCDLKDVVSYVDGKFVSSDFIGCRHSAVVDLRQIQVVDKLITVGAWYDNEMGYSCRLLDLVKHMADVDSKLTSSANGSEAKFLIPKRSLRQKHDCIMLNI